MPLLAFAIVAAAPHVKTAAYYNSYVGLPSAPIDVVARWLSWAETDLVHGPMLQALGVKTMVYTNPNRTISGQPEFSRDESTFAHDCGGNRIVGSIDGRPQYLMDPHSQSLARRWTAVAREYMNAAHFDAIVEDDADDVNYMPTLPCNYSAEDWLAATVAMQAKMGFPVIYNGLGVFAGQDVSQSIGLNSTALGGMAESCYGDARFAGHTSTGWRWHTMEETERLMARYRKLFFCYVNDTGPASALIGPRLFVYASFLLTYDPATSILWEYYATPSKFHVMPEVQLVPTEPTTADLNSIDDLRRDGIYERVYRQCFLRGRPVGECMVAVNPDTVSHHLEGAGSFARTLALSGSGVLDGGMINVTNSAVPNELPAGSGIIGFR